MKLAIRGLSFREETVQGSMAGKLVTTRSTILDRNVRFEMGKKVKIIEVHQRFF